MTKEVMTIPQRKSFLLNKVKLIKGGGLDVQYELIESFGDETYMNKYHVENSKDVHPDIRLWFEELRPILGRLFHLTSFLSCIESPDFNGTEDQRSCARDFIKELFGFIEIRGISLSGKDDNVGVVISGLMSMNNNQKTAINSPRLRLDSEIFGFEEELENIISHIEEEVYQFLFMGKKAQLDLFDLSGNSLINNGDYSEEDEPATDDM